MLPRELIKAVKRLEIVARRAVNDQLAGSYQSVFKGRGMDFSDVREYQPGDDIRSIDWNVSARTEVLHVKQFVEERELTVILLVDTSGSLFFGTRGKLKRETAAELGALLAFSAIKNNDRVGLITFNETIDTYVPPKKGRKHVMRVITEILATDAEKKTTSISEALQFVSRVTKKKAVVFLISDFLDDDFETPLTIAGRRHEIIPVVISDSMEQNLPNVGLVPFEDPETGSIVMVDTSSKNVRAHFQTMVATRKHKREKLFRRLKMTPIEVETGSDYIGPLMSYFQRRARGM